MPTHFHTPTHRAASLSLCLWVFVLGALVGSGGMSWYWHGTVSAEHQLVINMSGQFADRRELIDVCLVAYDELWAKIELGREVEARRATPGGR